MAPHSSTLAWRIPWTEEPGGLQSMGSLRVRHNWETSLSLFTFHFHALEKEMATHSSILAWRIPGTEEPIGLPSMGSLRVGHDWLDLAAAAAATKRRLVYYIPPVVRFFTLENLRQILKEQILLISLCLIMIILWPSKNERKKWNCYSVLHKSTPPSWPFLSMEEEWGKWWEQEPPSCCVCAYTKTGPGFSL